ncbi:uL14 family ribosomal protein [Alphaproteobacteria bacterium endosymbiont of Tiliacea citrago]|uniref:uL14 family ribosomal protein n=1 Tax=Alphaproteobacteria bacterium endosymbiont of Tiliacea citrago TaxID=3077944 RepID=UPI00313E4F62
MIIKETVLRVIDNSGAKMARCFMVYKKSYASIGDIIKVSIIKATPTSKIKKGSVCKAVVVRTKKVFIRSDRSSLSFAYNDIVLLNEKLEVTATRVKGIVPKEIPSNIKTIAEGVV